ncbi:MAG: pilus assembly protein PilM [Gammaproteobacteria bacterium]|nr:pilus assembly protein PilM [Gammaproteobacteria bacterium]
MHGRKAVILEIGKAAFKIVTENNQSLLQIGEDLSTKHIDQIKAVLDKESAATGNLTLRVNLDNSRVLAKLVTLPASTEENLHEVIKYEMDRYTPFSANDVYFDYRIEGRLAEKDLIKVLLLVVRKEILKPIESMVEDGVIALERINIINLSNANHSINDVKLLRTLSSANHHQSTVKWLLVAAVGLIMLTAITPLIINYLHINKLSQELEKLESTVSEVKQLQSEYQKMLEQVGYLVAIKEKNPSIIGVLNLLTEVTPDHTFVQRLSIEDGLLSLQGLSASASEFIPIIDKTGQFEDIRFSAPVTLSATDNLENYSITARLISHKDE